ncbi:hypothetical protein [Crocosphaera sp. Alani8]|uniref:hypothetical protein n=1 Tax=Crocosphaera sp. Alani8 TaxID=3038952 RepID=UPI00313BC6D3
MSEATDISNWHQDFIASNLLVIGYNAWAGHLSQKRGAIVCSLNSAKVGVAGESFKTHFIGQSRLAPFLNAWLTAPDTAILPHRFMISHILEVVDNYDPTTEVVLLLESFGQASFFYLKNLPITPPQCYEQVRKTWDEFQPGVSVWKDEQLPRVNFNHIN